MTNKTALDPPGSRAHPGGPPGPGRERRDAVGEFERLYRANVDAVTSFFARRTTDPQAVADLTADTFVAAITSMGTFDPGKGTARAWVFGIARRVHAAHCEARARQHDQARRLAGRRDLPPDHIEELEARIDAERSGRRLLRSLSALPEPDRAAVELVDIAGLRPAEAAKVLGTTAGALRMRLTRARARLRREAGAATDASNVNEDDHDELL